MKKSLFVILVFAVAAFSQAPKDFTRFVNPFIGTGGHGHTFPGATMPFGMVQLSPDTRQDNWDGSSGYHYSDKVIWGFSHTHLSGTGIPDYCDILFAPTIGEPEMFAKSGDVGENGYASAFSHENEKAEPGYYSVKLDEGNILAEMTATTRVGFHRYTFPSTDEANLIVDLKHRDKVLESDLKIVGKNRIEGFRRSRSWANDQVIYFVAEFSQDFAVANSVDKLQAALRFKTSAAKPLLVKVALSTVSIEGARKNLAAEAPDWNFDKVRAAAKSVWNKELSQIEVSGGTDAEMTNFYTALYHTKIQPNAANDVDGQYRGLDKKTHSLPASTEISDQTTQNYTIFSLWDTFRAAHPLYTITDRKKVVSFINTFIRQYEQGGRLPVWELAANETDCMIGYHSVSVIADAMAKDIGGFDYEKAFEAAKHSAELDHFGLAAYKKRGYISMEDENESVSKTLEYAYDDFCIATMAKILADRGREKWRASGNAIPRAAAVRDRKQKQRSYYPNFKRYEADYNRYLKRAQSYKNLFEFETGFMRPRQNGGWVSPFAPNEVTFNFTEGNSWVYTFFAPQDVSGLMKLQGGREKFAAKLDALFSTEDKLAGRFQPDITGLIGQYAHGNEPSHHIAYLYNYAGQPWKTQKLVRKILDEFYKPEPDGLIGNEDCGQMSAWFIMSALGFYQVNPGQPVYALGTPLFPSAKIRLENGKVFTINALNVSPKNFYVRKVQVNGKDSRQSFINHSDIADGGVLTFTMGDAAAEKWFTTPPVSELEDTVPSAPAINGPRVFTGKTTISISSENDKVVFYIVEADGKVSEPIPYEKPFEIDRTVGIRAKGIDPGGQETAIVESKFLRLPHDWGVKIESKYNRQYTGGGDFGLIDGIRGTTTFASGEWQGYQPQDFVAVVDLKRPTEIKRVGGGFLQNARSWIWMPTRIEFEVSDDGVTFKKVAEIKTDVAPDDMTPQIKDYAAAIAPVTTRYVRVHAYNLGKIPAWHPGAGDDAFIFVDEILID